MFRINANDWVSFTLFTFCCCLIEVIFSSLPLFLSPPLLSKYEVYNEPMRSDLSPYFYIDFFRNWSLHFLFSLSLHLLMTWHFWREKSNYFISIKASIENTNWSFAVKFCPKMAERINTTLLLAVTCCAALTDSITELQSLHIDPSIYLFATSGGMARWRLIIWWSLSALTQLKIFICHCGVVFSQCFEWKCQFLVSQQLRAAFFFNYRFGGALSTQQTIERNFHSGAAQRIQPSAKEVRRSNLFSASFLLLTLLPQNYRYLLSWTRALSLRRTAS